MLTTAKAASSLGRVPRAVATLISDASYLSPAEQSADLALDFDKYMIGHEARALILQKPCAPSRRADRGLIGVESIDLFWLQV